MLPPSPPSGAARWVVLLILLTITVLGLRASPVTSPTIADYRAHFLRYEGYRTRVYGRGPREPYLIGMGHRLTRAEARSHSPHWTHAEIDALFLADLSRAIDAARIAFPSFDTQPPAVQVVLTDLAYSCGVTGVLRWTRLREAVEARAYGKAAAEVARSLWYRSQVAVDRGSYAHRTMLGLALRVQ